MFLDVLRRRNPGLVEQAIALHQSGAIPANSYLIDLDAVTTNATLIKSEADKVGLKVFAMTKQMGRNGDFCRAVLAGGIDKAVAVDMECARACTAAGLDLGNVGHLVQVPRHEAASAARLHPDFWTVFNRQKAVEASKASHASQRRQPLLARLQAPGDTFYRGHEGGFAADDVVAVANVLDQLDGGVFAGITTFPAVLFENDAGAVHATPNLKTLARSVDALRRAGRHDIEVNAPGTTSSVTLALLANHGATQCEPGHGLTGTTPLHAVRDLPERPAVCYVSEVSHLHAGRAYCFGGGLYIDPVFPAYQVTAVVGRDPAAVCGPTHSVEIPPPAAIDYYGMVEAEGPLTPEVGDTVVFGFRPQAFVTRAYTVGVSGISTGRAAVQTIHDAFGRPVQWPDAGGRN